MPPTPWPRRILRLLGLSLAGLVITAAVLLTLARATLPFADTLRPKIVAWAERALGQAVDIGRLDADWRGMEPGLILIDTTLLDHEGRPLLHLKRARIGLDLWASLRHRTLTPGRIHLSGLRLAVIRDAQGRLRIRGLGTGEHRPGGGRDFARWLLGHKRLTVEDSEIHYRDETPTDPSEWTFRHVTLDLRNHRGRHLIDATLALPYRMGHGLDLALELQGDVLSAHRWNGRGYLSIRGLRLEQLPAQWRNLPVHIEGGRLESQLWAWWQDGRLQRLNGTLDLRDLVLLRQRDRQLLRIAQAGGVIDWQGEADGRWWLAAQRLRLHTETRDTPPSRLWIHHRPADGDRPARWEMALDHLHLEDLERIGRFSDRLPPQIESALDRLRPSGRLDEVRLTAERHRDQWRYRLQAGVRNLRNHPWQWIPGSDGIDGEIRLSERGGEARLRGRRLQLGLERLYDHPLPLTRLQAEIRWRRAPRAWVVDIHRLHGENRYLALAARLRLNLPTDGRSPRLILGTRLRLPNPDRLREHLPTRLLAPGLRHWLDQALHAGAVEDGEVLYLGRTHQFPFREDQGRLAIQLRLAQGRLTPAPGWPLIDAIQGRLTIDHRRLRLEDAGGRIYRSHLHDVEVTLPDLGAPKQRLEIQGRVNSDAADVLRYLHASPLEEAFAAALHPFEAQGPLRLRLGLVIPLHDAEVTVDGHARLDGVHLRSEHYAVDLHDLRGPLQFDQRGITSPGLQGRLDGLPLELALETEDDPHRLHIDGHGRIHRESLRRLLARYSDYPHWADYTAGQTRWSGRLSLPLSEDDPNPPRLTVHSNLQGLAVTLPAPLNKPSDRRTPFGLTMELGEEERRLGIDYGELRALLELRREGDDFRLHRGAVGLGRQPILPDEDGLWFTGHAPYFSWSAWSRVLFPEDGRPPLFPDEGSATLGQYYDITLDELEVFDFQFEDVALQATDSAQGWTIHTRGPRLAGTIFVPVSVTTAPLSMDMRRLHLRTPPPEARTPSTTRPTELPAFVIDAEDFRFDRLRFGRLSLRASRIPRGLRLDRLTMRTAATDITARGQWLEDPPAPEHPRPQQRSRFHIEADSNDLGTTLKEWDYAGTIAGGRGRILIDAHWPGNPAQFDLARLEGQLELNLENGRLLEIEPGAARIFGLISLHALPRRLALDFSDLFAKGFAFDRIAGRYRVKGGIATTQGLVMEGPAGRIVARGKIDLARRRYDQEVAIIPPLGGSLPLIGTALTGAPPVGATLLLLQKLLEKPLSELSTIRYRVTGPWNAPKVERIHADPEPSEELLSDE